MYRSYSKAGSASYELGLVGADMYLAMIAGNDLEPHPTAKGDRIALRRRLLIMHLGVGVESDDGALPGTIFDARGARFALDSTL
jgi:hypothetical protein